MSANQILLGHQNVLFKVVELGRAIFGAPLESVIVGHKLRPYMNDV